jgi:CheY-like chemotaxis protein
MGRAVPGRKPVVLVVEDENLIRLSALDMVEEGGFEAIAASDADEAIRILESRNDIRAVFTDVHMPGSMDGLRLARVVRNRWPPVALIVTSGRRSVLETDLPPGGRFLDKPYEPTQIEAALRELICQQVPRRSLQSEGQCSAAGVRPLAWARRCVWFVLAAAPRDALQVREWCG